MLSDTKKKKLLVLSSTYPRWDDDWEPAFVHELSKRLTSDFDVTVLCPREKGSVRREIKDKVNVHRYRYAPNCASTLVSNGGIAANLKNTKLKWLLVPFFFLAQTLAITIAIKRHKPDVIHCHWIIPQGVCLYLAKILTRSKIPHLLTSHGGDLYTFRGMLLTKLKKAVLCHARSITVVSHAMTTEVERIAGKALDIRVIPMGIDTKNTFYPDESVIRSKTEILFVGRLVEKKGVRYLIEAFKLVLNSVPEATLTIIGEGPEKVTLKSLVENLNLEHQVRFLGSMQNSRLPAYYRRATVFAAPFIRAKSGDEEGFGLVVAEALCCGCPVVVTDLPAVEDLFSRAKDIAKITVVPQARSSTLATAISNYFRESLSTHLTQANLSEIFGWDTTQNVYAKLLSK
jgi:glycosyltransferase involved in cell wall biosynthesis